MNATTQNLDELRARAAELVVLDAYDRARARGYLDLGGSRRRTALRKREAALNAALDAARIPAPTPTYDDLVDAFKAEARRRLARRDGAPASTRNALRRAAADLGIDGIYLTELGVAADLERIPNRSRTYTVVA